MQDKDKPTSYWFITVFRTLKQDDNGFLDIGASRCWGFFIDKDEALTVLHNNETDLCETIYRYAVLEEFHEGISNYGFNRQFFEYNKEKDSYVEINEPEFCKHSVCFAIG